MHKLHKKQLQALGTKQTQTEQNKHNITKQIEDDDAEIETLRNGMAQLLSEWQAIYPDADVSPKWASEQFIEANTAITAIGDAEKAHTQASHAYQIAIHSNSKTAKIISLTRRSP